MDARMFSLGVAWIAGLVAGLLLRSTSGYHGALAAVVVVAVNAAALGVVARWGKR